MFTTAPATDPVSPLRADAARNRERIIAAAATVFAERGLEASTKEIAARAGVGEATLFRRFPTKDDLVLAIIALRLEDAIQLAESCLAEDDPWRAIERFMFTMGERSSSDRGISDSAGASAVIAPELESARRRILHLSSELVRRARRAGAIREDVSGQDLLFLQAAVGVYGGMPCPGLRADLWKRYLGIMLDGLRADRPSRLRPATPPRRRFERPDRA